jgi:hypothetical protein
MPKTLIRLCSIVLIAGSVAIAEDDMWTWGRYRRSVISPSSAVKSAAGAGIAQWQDNPTEWGQGMDGYSKRYVSRLAQHAVRGSIEFGVSGWRHENLKYVPSNREGKWSRIKYAVKQTFIVPSTDGTGDKLATSRFAGVFGAGLISRTWMPPSRNDIGRGFLSGGYALGIGSAMNVVREFWPKKRPKN